MPIASTQLQDGFSGSQTAPQTPRTCDNTGYVNLTGSVITVGSGTLNLNGTIVANTGFIAANSGGTDRLFTRAFGLAMLFKTPTRTTVSSNCRIGWNINPLSSTSMSYGIEYSNTTTIAVRENGSSADTFSLGAGEHEFALVQQGTGAYLLQRVAGGSWTLQWHFRTLTSDMYAKLVLLSNTALNFTIDDLRIQTMSGTEWTTQFGLATVNQASPANNTQFDIGQSNYIVHATMTAPGSVTQDSYIRFNMVDANNYHRVGYNSSRAFRVDRVTAGVATNLISANNAITAGGSATVCVYKNGSELRFYTLPAGSTWTKRGSTLTTETQGQSSSLIETNYNNWTMSDLVGLRRTYTPYEDLTSTAITLTPTTGSIELNGNTTTMAMGGVTLTPSAGSIEANGDAPSLTLGVVTLTPTSGSVEVNGNTTSLSFGGVTLSPTAGTVEVTGNTTILSLGGVTLTPASGSVTVTGNDAALVVGDITLTPTTGSIVVTGSDTTLTLGAITLTPTAGSIELTGNDAVLEGGGAGPITLTPTSGSVEVAGNTPALSMGGVSLTPASGSIELTGNTATISGALSLTPTAGSIEVTGNTPTITATLTLVTTTGSITVTGNTPILVVGGVALTPAAGEIVLSGNTPQLVMGGIALDVESGSIVVMGEEAELFQGDPARTMVVGIIVAGTAQTSILVPAASGQIRAAGAASARDAAAGSAQINIIPAGRAEVEIS